MRVLSSTLPTTSDPFQEVEFRNQLVDRLFTFVSAQVSFIHSNDRASFSLLYFTSALIYSHTHTHIHTHTHTHIYFSLTFLSRMLYSLAVIRSSPTHPYNVQNQVLQSGDWELDVAMVRAVSALLEGLLLRPIDDDADVVRL